jgi:hypothetical protein
VAREGIIGRFIWYFVFRTHLNEKKYCLTVNFDIVTIKTYRLNADMTLYRQVLDLSLRIRKSFVKSSSELSKKKLGTLPTSGIFAFFLARQPQGVLLHRFPPLKPRANEFSLPCNKREKKGICSICTRFEWWETI